MQNFQNALNARLSLNGKAAELVGAEEFVMETVGHNLPDITLRSPNFALAPGNANYRTPGTGIEHGPLNFRCLLDENMNSWLYIANWMYFLAADVQRIQIYRKELENASLSIDILDNNKKPNLTFTFLGVFPEILAEAEWDHQDTTPTPQQFTVSFGYRRFHATNTKTGELVFPLFTDSE